METLNVDLKSLQDQIEKFSRLARVHAEIAKLEKDFLLGIIIYFFKINCLAKVCEIDLSHISDQLDSGRKEFEQTKEGMKFSESEQDQAKIWKEIGVKMEEINKAALEFMPILREVCSDNFRDYHWANVRLSFVEK